MALTGLRSNRRMLITPEISSAVNFARLSRCVFYTWFKELSGFEVRCEKSVPGPDAQFLFSLRLFCLFAVFLTFRHSFLAIYLIISLLLFSVICVSCFNLHKVKLEEHNALLKQKGGEDNNKQDDNPSRCIISVAKYQYQYVAINYVTIDEFHRK